MARIQDKIIFSFVGLLLIALVSTFLMISVTTWSFIRSNAKDQLTVSLNLLNKLLNARTESTLEALQNLSEDTAFKKQLLLGKKQEIDETLKHVSFKLKPDFMLVVTSESVLAYPEESKNVLEEVKKTLGKNVSNSFDQFLVFKDKLYQLVVIPILDPTPIGWLCAGLLVNDSFSEELKSFTHLEVLFLIKQDKKWRLAASSLQGGDRSLLLSFIKNNPQKATLTLSQKDYMLQVSSLAKTKNSEIVNVGLLEMRNAERSMFSILIQMAGIFLSCLIISLIITVVLAKDIIKPLRKFVEGSRKIAEEHSFEPLSIPDENELAELAHEFNQMQVALTRRESEIQYRAFYDALTNLPNRALFQEQLETAIKIAKQKNGMVGVLVMDLNRFKDINDTLGHQSGDKVLKQVSHRLSDTFSTPQFVISRLGGDEFALMLPDTSSEHTATIARRMGQALNKPFMVEGMKLDISASIGAALFPLHAQDASTMLQKADIAMYVAKEQKKVFCFYEQDLDKHSVLRLSLMSELKAAVKHNELVLYYQPKVELRDHSIRQVEALVRWIHPKHGLVTPTQFIPLAEQTGYVRDLTRWALLTAAKQCFEWKLAGVPIKVAVNMSAIDLLDVKLEEDIREVFNIVPIDPNQFVLEVTESAIMINPEHAISTLSKLSEMGILLSLDDFGTGQSSMAQLKKLPVSELKIDQSFISNMIQDRHDEIMVKSMIELGHNMGLTVVGEGVDNARIFELLEQYHCDKAQGHFISPPLSITEFSRWLLQSPYRLVDL